MFMTASEWNAHTSQYLDTAKDESVPVGRRDESIAQLLYNAAQEANMLQRTVVTRAKRLSIIKNDKC
jgi:antitoxin (DNA-binding transcriptional repressor) of toxin-antitoxin stability system